MRLSLCMIVRDEAENLARCLQSVQGVVDEMIVLDTGSIDDTVAIAQSFLATVHHFPWSHDFSVARNEALKYVTGDWILVLDADEVLLPEVVPLLRSIMAQPHALVINLIRQEVGATQSPFSLVSRLFRHHPSVFFTRPYHALIDDSVTALLQQEPHWQIVDLSDVAILHYGYEPGAIATQNKLQKAKITMASFLAAHPNDPYVCSKLGALYVEIGELQSGITLMIRALSQNSKRKKGKLTVAPLSPAILYELHYHLGIAYSRSHDFGRAERHYEFAIAQPILERLKLGAYNNLGGLLKSKGQLLEAKTAYESVIAIAPDLAIGYYNLGMTLKTMGHLTEAIEQYKIAIELHPNYAEAHQNLGVALLKLGLVPASLEAFKRSIELHEQQASPEGDRLRQGLQQMGFQL